MRPLICAILMAFFLASFGAGFQKPPGPSGPVAIATVLNSQYCLGTPSAHLPMVLRNGRPEPIELYPPDAITLRLQLGVVYRNAASKPWIVPVPTQTVVLMGTMLDALVEVPQPVLAQGPAPSDKLDDGEEAPTPALFPAIAPSETLNVVSPLETVLVRLYTPSIRSEPDMRGKRIYVRLEYFSSRWTQRLLTRLAKKWKNYGNLWTDSVSTQPIEIDVPAKPEITNCLK